MNSILTDITKEPRHEQAAAWFMALYDEEVADETIQGWQHWMLAEANRKAYDEIERLWHRVGDLAPMTMPAPVAESGPVFDGSLTVRAYTRQHRKPSKRAADRAGDRRFQYGMAAVFAAIGIAVLLMLQFYRGGASSPGTLSVFETLVAQHQDIVLNDGSHVQLGARSSITTSVSSSERTIVLDRGEAAFKVAHDADRPFRVLAGGGMITAVGTAFNVRRLDGVVIVTVTEGSVQVEPANGNAAGAGISFPQGKVSRGQEISYGGPGSVSVVRKVDPDLAMAWRDGRLQYRSEPLSRVVQDIARYSPRAISVGDAAAGGILYSGTVFERDIDDWLAALDKVFPEVQVVQPDEEHIIIRSRNPRTR